MIHKTNKFYLFLITMLLFVSTAKSMDVDISGKLCKEEIGYLRTRKPIVEQAQDTLVGRKLLKHPNMGICLTGGGYRAMISSFGFLLGAQKIGLLDAANYSSSLSGSTWNIASTFARSATSKKRINSLETLRPILQKRTEKSFWNFTTLNWKAILQRLATKWETYGKIEPADVWGAILVDRLMGDLPSGGQRLTFAHIRNFLKKNTQYPFPLFSAVIKNTFEIEGNYEWFEVNPFASGSDYLHGFVHTKDLGSTFQEGQITQKRKEESLGFFLAIFGSPYDLNVGDLLLQVGQMIPETIPFKHQILDCLHIIIKDLGLAQKNLLPSNINSPTYKMESSPYQEEFLTLADSGFDFNLSAPPFLRRKLDIFVCCDDSSDAESQGFPELKLVKAYADRHELAFPSFSRFTKINKHLFIFKWNDTGQESIEIPTVIYFCNPIQDSTFKLQYSKKEFDDLCDFMKHLVLQSKSVIASEIAARESLES